MNDKERNALRNQVLRGIWFYPDDKQPEILAHLDTETDAEAFRQWMRTEFPENCYTV